MTETDAAWIEHFWRALGGDPARMVVDCGVGAITAFDPTSGCVRFGADVYPGEGRSPNERVEVQAAIAHELRHQQRFDAGVVFEGEGVWHIEEAITSLEAAEYSTLDADHRWQLVWDALQRLYTPLSADAVKVDPLRLLLETLTPALTLLAEEHVDEH